MLKILLLILVLVVLVGGGYFIFANKYSPTSSNQIVKKVKVPTPKSTEVATVSDQVVADDMTALEKDLVDLDSENSSLSGELNHI